MNEDPASRFSIGLYTALGISWSFSTLMAINGFDMQGNWVWSVFSITRWLLTAVALVWVLIQLVPKWTESMRKEDERRQAAYEKAIEDEVERRLKILVNQQAKQKETEIKLAKQEEERNRERLEAQWRKEFETKIAEQFRLTRSAHEATEKAFGDFI